MADLARASQITDYSKLLNRIIFIPNFGFIIYLVTLIHQSEQGALIKFQDLRNMAYMGYIGLFLMIGIFTFIGRRVIRTNYQKTNFLPSVLPVLIISLILTTFSYFLAKIIADLLELFNLF